MPQPAGRVDDHDVVQAVPCLLERLARHLDRIADAVAGRGRENRHRRLPAEHLELLDGIGPLQVSGDEQRGVALLAQPERKLGRESGLAGALQAGQHDHGRRHLGEAQPPCLAAEDRDELLVNDLDDLLGRVQRRGDLFAGGPLLDLGDEGPDNRQGDICLQQRDPDFTAGGVNIGGRKPPVPAQRGEDLGEPVGKSLEHVSLPSSRRCQGSGASGTARHCWDVRTGLAPGQPGTPESRARHVPGYRLSRRGWRRRRPRARTAPGRPGPRRGRRA